MSHHDFADSDRETGGEGDEGIGGDQNDQRERKKETEYYQFLHVPRNATETEISAAYKRLSR